ncbi:hypothetical protein B9G55_14670 [Saccharibacillus sp. O16]|nr:hypothetical protein B9G55_14670 [Saccharibacillus sp. O16]
MEQDTVVSQSSTKKVKMASVGEADVDIYSSFAEVERVAPVIVEVQRTEAERAKDTSTDADGVVLDTWEVTEVEVNQVFKGNIEPKSKIKVAEPGYYDENGTYISYEGYKLMENGDRYLLTLRPSTDDSYIVIGLFQGKFNLDKKSPDQKITSNEISKQEFQQADYVGENEEQFNKLKQEVLAKYAN